MSCEWKQLHRQKRKEVRNLFSRMAELHHVVVAVVVVAAAAVDILSAVVVIVVVVFFLSPTM